jgi:hypothetical protein
VYLGDQGRTAHGRVLIPADVHVPAEGVDAPELSLLDGLSLEVEAADVEVHGEYSMNSVLRMPFDPVQPPPTSEVRVAPSRLLS